jgi:hypothetical protein
VRCHYHLELDSKVVPGRLHVDKRPEDEVQGDARYPSILTWAKSKHKYHILAANNLRETHRSFVSTQVASTFSHQKSVSRKPSIAVLGAQCEQMDRIVQQSLCIEKAWASRSPADCRHGSPHCDVGGHRAQMYVAHLSGRRGFQGNSKEFHATLHDTISFGLIWSQALLDGVVWLLRLTGSASLAPGYINDGQ